MVKRWAGGPETVGSSPAIPTQAVLHFLFVLCPKGTTEEKVDMNIRLLVVLLHRS